MAFNQQQQQQHHVGSVGTSSSLSNSVPNNYINSYLDESEWILFSPTNSNPTELRDDDILSSISNETLNEIEDDDEEEDSLIDSFNDQIIKQNKHSIYSNDDLETRINNWRKEQIHDMLDELTSKSYKNSIDDLDKIDFMKSWGIDDGKIRLKKKVKLKIARKELKELFYGSNLLQRLDKDDIKVIKKILVKFSKELKTDDVKDSRPHYIKNLQEINKDLKLSHHHHHNHHHQIGGLLQNPDLEKYLPIFIKDLIIENQNKNWNDNNNNDIHQSNNFWDTDLKSCNSSLLSLSTNSMMFNFNLNEFA